MPTVNGWRWLVVNKQLIFNHWGPQKMVPKGMITACCACHTPSLDAVRGGFSLVFWVAPSPTCPIIIIGMVGWSSFAIAWFIILQLGWFIAINHVEWIVPIMDCSSVCTMLGRPGPAARNACRTLDVPKKPCQVRDEAAVAGHGAERVELVMLGGG